MGVGAVWCDGVECGVDVRASVRIRDSGSVSVLGVGRVSGSVSDGEGVSVFLAFFCC